MLQFAKEPEEKFIVAEQEMVFMFKDPTGW
jgi:hypothetical protein